jgi:hypothetical protein
MCVKSKPRAQPVRENVELCPLRRRCEERSDNALSAVIPREGGEANAPRRLYEVPGASGTLVARPSRTTTAEPIGRNGLIYAFKVSRNRTGSP